MKTDYKKIFFITAASIAVSLIYNAFSANGVSLIRDEINIVYEDRETVSENASENQNSIRVLTTEQVYAIFTNKEAVFIDGRDSWDFAEGRIPGAINIPEYKFTPDDLNLKLLDKDDKLIVYCEGDQCEVSKRLAAELMKLGYKKVWVYLGGFKEWWENKFPIEKE